MTYNELQKQLNQQEQKLTQAYTEYKNDLKQLNVELGAAANPSMIKLIVTGVVIVIGAFLIYSGSFTSGIFMLVVGIAVFALFKNNRDTEREANLKQIEPLKEMIPDLKI